ncbi:rhodanese-like domain-containing protein [Haloarcula sp. H-GB5]
MKRRSFLSSAAGAVVLTAGCTSSARSSAAENYHDIINPDPSASNAGLASNPAEVDARNVEPSSFETYTATNEANTNLRMVPLDIARYWYHTQKARFIDTRTASQYQESHIAGAVFSPAPNGKENDPVANWDKNERVVAYCTCPHHLSGIRAGNLIEDGFTGAYILGPGMEPWAKKGYPTAGMQKNKTEFVDDYSNVNGNDENERQE